MFIKNIINLKSIFFTGFTLFGRDGSIATMSEVRIPFVSRLGRRPYLYHQKYIEYIEYMERRSKDVR